MTRCSSGSDAASAHAADEEGGEPPSGASAPVHAGATPTLAAFAAITIAVGIAAGSAMHLVGTRDAPPGPDATREAADTGPERSLSEGGALAVWPRFDPPGLAVWPRFDPSATAEEERGGGERRGERGDTEEETGASEEIAVDTSAYEEAELQPEVIAAVRSAAELTGADPAYLMAVAWKESRFDVRAAAPNTSARGLFQFTKATWMRAVRAFGERHGLGAMASGITELADGRMAVRKGMRGKLLDLREDPALSALMAAEFSQMDRRRLERALDREARPVDLYMAHLLGISSAVRFIKAAEARPGTPSSTVVPKAARNNPGLFSRKGRTLSVSAVYRAVAGELAALRERYDGLLEIADRLLPGGGTADGGESASGTIRGNALRVAANP